MSFIKISEQQSLYDNLEDKSVREILEEINNEDQKVALAVHKTLPQIEELVNLMKYQSSYQASAKVVSTINQMLDTLLGMKQ